MLAEDPAGDFAIKAPRVDAETAARGLERLRSEQRFGLGIAAGLGAAAAGAVAWAVVTCVTGYQIGFLALGVGALVGYAVQYSGRGVDMHFGIVGAVLALVGCLAGNLLSAAYFLAVEVDVGYFDVLRELTPSFAYELLEATFSPMDLLFYGIAVYEGYRFAFRRVGEGELLQAAGVAAPVSAAAEAQATPPARPVASASEHAASEEAQP